MKLGIQPNPEGGFFILYQEGVEPNPGTDVVLSQATVIKCLRALADLLMIRHNETAV